jgi:hypothetical protein
MQPVTFIRQGSRAVPDNLVDVAAHFGHDIKCQKIVLDPRQLAGLYDFALHAHVTGAGGRAAVEA